MEATMKMGLLRRRQFICGCCATLVGARIVPAFAAIGDDAATAPLARNEPHHHLVLQNEFVRVFRVLIPPGSSTLWHEHDFDYVVLQVNGTTIQVDVATSPQATAGTMVTKSLTYVNYAGKRFVHRAHNTDTAVNHQLAFEIIPPSPAGSGATDRSGAPQYKVEIDNDRLRAWRMQLAPGETADRITQKTPAVRFVLSGERIVEEDTSGQVKEIAVRAGDFAWLSAATSRSVTNAGASPLELVEVELK